MLHVCVVLLCCQKMKRYTNKYKWYLFYLRLSTRPVLLCASEKSVVIIKERAYSHQLRKLSYENHNIICIVEFCTEFIILAMRIHSEGFELTATTDIMPHSTTTTHQLTVNISTIAVFNISLKYTWPAVVYHIFLPVVIFLFFVYFRVAIILTY